MANLNAVKLKQLSEDLYSKISSFNNAFNANLKLLEERMGNLNALKVKQVSEDLDAKISKNR
jgi:hypothetical protein